MTVHLQKQANKAEALQLLRFVLAKSEQFQIKKIFFHLQTHFFVYKNLKNFHPICKKRKSRTFVLLSVDGDPKYFKVEYGNFADGEYLLALRLANKYGNAVRGLIIMH